MVAVEFVVSHSVNGALYNAGEIAGFEPDVAAKLVEAGVAKDIKPAKK